MNAVVDNDVLLKSASYGLLGPIVAESLGSNPLFGFLGAARFIVPKKLAKAKLRRDPSEAIQELGRWFDASVAIETAEHEQLLAAALESAAQHLGLPLDAGESQLCAVLISRSVPTMFTGDKRAIAALEALVDRDERVFTLCGRIRSIEQLVRNALKRTQLDRLRSAICAEPEVDKSLNSIFACTSVAANVEGVQAGLSSYIEDLRSRAQRILAPD